MSLVPYDPAEDLLRKILIARSPSHEVVRLDETLQTFAGASFTSELITQSLNRQEATRRKATLRRFVLDLVTTAVTTLEISASGDGGVTFPEIKTITTIATSGVQTAVLGFSVTGFDLRVRIRHATDFLVLILAMTPYLALKGKA